MEKSNVTRQTRMLSAILLIIGLLWIATMFYCVFFSKEPFSFREINICFVLTEGVCAIFVALLYRKMLLKLEKSFCRKVLPVVSALVAGLYNGIGLVFFILNPVAVALGIVLYVIETVSLAFVFEEL